MSVFASRPAAVLVLADGSVFTGVAIGAVGSAVGEVVFNTALTGYQEILTDPSYCRQLVAMTYPHIGNTGCNDEDNESVGHFPAGLIVRDLSLRVSNHRATASLAEVLRAKGVVAIAEVDTRALTRRLRDGGAQSGCLVCPQSGQVSQRDIDEALTSARAFPGLAGMDLAAEVSCREPYVWNQGSWRLGRGFATVSPSAASPHVIAYDFGVKHAILRLLVDQGCRVTVVPAKTTANEALALKPDGIFLANGPGDPEPCDYAIDAIRHFLERSIPIFGICLGHQLLALASGGRTIKMKFGHHGANHPVKELATGRVFISSQNHGFAVDADSLPPQVKITHVSLFDGSLQGIARTDKPAFSFQGHPEASPGPQELTSLFRAFRALLPT